MRLFSQRKTRTMKAATLAASNSLRSRVLGRLSDTNILLQLVICAILLILLVVSLEGWRAPFLYRQGMVISTGVIAATDFERVNLRKTELARLEQEESVPPVYRHDKSLLWDLQDQLRRHLFDVAEVTTPEDLSADARAAFGFNQDVLTAEQQADWEALRKAVSPIENAERQIDEILSEFSGLVSGLSQIGVLDPNELTRHDLRAEEPVTILTGDSPTDRQTVIAADVLMGEILKASGTIGSRWKSSTLLAPIQRPLEQWLQQKTPYTLLFDDLVTAAAIQTARASTPSITDQYKRGAILVAPGAVLEKESVEVLQAQYDAIEKRVPWSHRVARVATVVLLLLMLGGLNAVYLVRFEPRIVQSSGRLAVYLGAVTLAVALGRLLSIDPWRAEVIPLLSTVMILAIAYNQVLAALTGFSLTLILTLASGGTFSAFVVMIGVITASVVPLAQVSSRSKLVKVGLWTAATSLLLNCGVQVISAQDLSVLWKDHQLLMESLKGAGWCIAAGYLVAGSLPFIEQVFGVVTDISLLELSDVSHPLLQELVRRAPGTYNHSITVATISETAADRIGANGLLCRVGAYFHDIGKMLKPHYFVENLLQGQSNRHEALNPAMSTLVIIGHVKDGADLARQHGLPEPLLDFIEQHHGTTLVEYFFHAATRQAESQPDRGAVEESSFRYPGPKPQSREAAVMMIADACEGASRTLTDPTPRRIETLVHELAMKRLLDGQFDECSLTLSELAQVEDSLTKSLIGIHHARIRYPEQKSA